MKHSPGCKCSVCREKYSHEEVGYEHPAKGPHHCSECKHYETGGGWHCEIVKDPIHPEDWCKKFLQRR